MSTLSTCKLNVCCSSYKKTYCELTTCQVCQGVIPRCRVTCQRDKSHQIEPLKVLHSFVSLFLPDGNMTDLLGHGCGFSCGIWRRHRREEKYGWCLSWFWTSSWPNGFKETMNSKLTTSTVNHVSVLRLLTDTDHRQCADIVRWWDEKVFVGVYRLFKMSTVPCWPSVVLQNRCLPLLL